MFVCFFLIERTFIFHSNSLCFKMQFAFKSVFYGTSLHCRPFVTTAHWLACGSYAVFSFQLYLICKSHPTCCSKAVQTRWTMYFFLEPLFWVMVYHYWRAAAFRWFWPRALRDEGLCLSEWKLATLTQSCWNQAPKFNDQARGVFSFFLTALLPAAVTRPCYRRRRLSAVCRTSNVVEDAELVCLFICLVAWLFGCMWIVVVYVWDVWTSQPAAAPRQHLAGEYTNINQYDYWYNQLIWSIVFILIATNQFFIVEDTQTHTHLSMLHRAVLDEIFCPSGCCQWCWRLDENHFG